MSKIQKALGRLRADERHIDDSSGESSKAKDGASSRKKRHDSSLRRRRYTVPGEALSNEVSPKIWMKVDIEGLKEFGLQFPESDTELLGQQFRRIKRPVLNIGFGDLSANTENSNVIMVASALPKSGKTFCSYNLAASIARERDIGAVLVDADVLRPNASRAFGVEEKVGLIDYLLDPNITLDEILIGTDLHDIIIVPAGQQHEEATELLASQRMEHLVHELSVRFSARAIIVDTPPLLVTNEAHVVAKHMGQIVFVIEAGKTSQEAVVNALESLNQDKPINAIINKVRGSNKKGHGSGYSGSYYGYYPIEGDDDE